MKVTCPPLHAYTSRRTLTPSGTWYVGSIEFLHTRIKETTVLKIKLVQGSGKNIVSVL
jgi:hypothetical protein